LSAELDELLEWLLTDVIADDVTSAETALRELDVKCERLGKHCNLIMKLSYTICNVIYADIYNSFQILSNSCRLNAVQSVCSCMVFRTDIY